MGKKTADCGEISLNDFANSKAHGSCSKIKKTYVVMKPYVDELDWFDKDIDDFLIDSDEEPPKPIVKKKKNKVSPYEYQREQGNTYPIDIWYILSYYISPEDVGRFALICKSSAAVINSMGFWRRLYKNHYDSKAQLPERLKPESMKRQYGLKTYVIRSLYHMYHPFREKIKVTPTHRSVEPYILKGCLCTATWHRKLRTGNWEFFFKLRRPGFSDSNKNRNLLEMLSDISYNSESGYRVLSIVCNTFILFHCPVGQFVCDIKVGLSGMMNQSIKIQFVPFRKVKHSVNEGLIVELQPVVKYNVMHWWHPEYPQMEEQEYVKKQKEEFAIISSEASAWDDR
ncbi:transmembrane protein 183-like [Artemia franciscana]